MPGSIVRVSEIMMPQVIIVDGMETVADAMQRMASENADALIVDKRNPDDEYGIVLLTNIVSKILSRDRAPERVNVYEIMSKPVISVNHDMNIRYCARLFTNIGISIAPVTKGEELVGMVSYRELAFGGLQ